MKKQVYENVILDDEYSPLLISMGQYKLFMAHGQTGRDAMNILLHLMFTGRLQHTNQVKANTRYIMAGVSMGEKRVKRAKALLSKLGIIEYVQRRAEDGKVGEQYIKVRYMPRREATAKAMTASLDRPVGSFTAPAVNRPTRSETQMLKVNKEMLEVRNLNGDSPQADMRQSPEPQENPRSEERGPDSESAATSLPSSAREEAAVAYYATERTSLPSWAREEADRLMALLDAMEVSYGVVGDASIRDADAPFYVWNNYRKHGDAYLSGFESYLNGHHKAEHDDHALRYFHGVIARGGAGLLMHGETLETLEEVYL